MGSAGHPKDMVATPQQWGSRASTSAPRLSCLAVGCSVVQGQEKAINLLCAGLGNVTAALGSLL